VELEQTADDRVSNSVPAPRSICAIASGGVSARRYGRSDVIASNASITLRIRASNGTSSPSRP
jgi:hypothetical protein